VERKPRITRGSDIAVCDGELVEVRGIYISLDVRRIPRPPAQYIGYVAIRLADDELVLLEPSWYPSARRGDAERKTCEGQTVAVVGTLYAEAPDNPDGGVSIRMPCLADVETVVLVS
jgi:hypothetical protein